MPAELEWKLHALLDELKLTTVQVIAETSKEGRNAPSATTIRRLCSTNLPPTIPLETASAVLRAVERLHGKAIHPSRLLAWNDNSKDRSRIPESKPSWNEQPSLNQLAKAAAKAAELLRERAPSTMQPPREEVQGRDAATHSHNNKES